MSILNTLGVFQWLLIAAVPPAILALYFLKLRRQPLEVPSTYLWSRTIEDLHVNSLWQKLRQNILLFLQLLLVLLMILSLLRPGFQGKDTVARRSIFVIDQSASMRATDVKPSRLEKAKERAREMIKGMSSGDVGMIIAISDEAHVVQPYTDNKRVLLRKLETIKPTNRRTDIEQAMRYASGLANPGRTSEDATDVQVAEPMPATMYVFSDGGFKGLPNFRLGHLTPEYHRIGSAEADNLAIGSFSIQRNPEKPEQIQAFARVDNFGDKEVEVEVSLYLDGTLRDAERLKIAKQHFQTAQFDMDDIETGELRLTLDRVDDLALDNTAFVAANLPRRAKVLMVTPGNDPLRMALSTIEAEKHAEIRMVAPAILTNEQYLQQAAAGAFDLIIFDRCAPKELPEANTLFIGAIPQDAGWTASEKSGPLLIIDTDRVHPLMQLLDMSNVNIVEGFSVKPPPGGSKLLEAETGAIIAIAPRQGFQDVVLGFDIYSTTKDGDTALNTDWHIRRSFPVFVMNALKHLGNAGGTLSTLSVAPGAPATLRSRLVVDYVTVTNPKGVSKRIEREGENAFVYTDTDEVGIYSVREGDSDEVAQKFSVNVFDQRESDILPAEEVNLGGEGIKGKTGRQKFRQELWKWILLAGLVVLIGEWYIYNRRVYL